MSSINSAAFSISGINTSQLSVGRLVLGILECYSYEYGDGWFTGEPKAMINCTNFIVPYLLPLYFEQVFYGLYLLIVLLEPLREFIIIYLLTKFRIISPSS